MAKKKRISLKATAGAQNPLDEAFMDLLQQNISLSKEQLVAFKKKNIGDGQALENALVHEGYITEAQLAQFKAQAHGWDSVNLYEQPVTEAVLNLLPLAAARAQNAVTFREHKGTVSVAISNPMQRPFLRLLQKKFRGNVNVYCATMNAIIDALARHDKGFQKRFEDLLTSHQEAVKDRRIDDASVIDLVDSILLQGVRHRASDIHIEPRRHETVVRERIDGILHTTLRFTNDVHKLVTLRIKVIANLATDEHAAPQDGKLSYETPMNKRVDVRVSIVPTTHGEKIVLRLLVTHDKSLTLESLGLREKDRNTVNTETNSSWGMILATGPTGSGKTTSLYAILQCLNTDEVNISTIEDPAEYDLPGANQIQVNEKVNLTFATGLRSIVRQDPNIVLVGEIRDSETAGIAVNAAMTGHLVLSTLHTNDAATALPRLVDMGVEPFLIASTVNLIVAQRLVRKICDKCKESIEMDVEDLRRSFSEEDFQKLTQGQPKIQVYHGKGCGACDGTGFFGRTGIFELLCVDETIRSLIMNSANAETITRAAIQAGMTTMKNDGIKKVLDGSTTIDEIFRVMRT